MCYLERGRMSFSLLSGMKASLTGGLPHTAATCPNKDLILKAHGLGLPITELHPEIDKKIPWHTQTIGSDLLSLLVALISLWRFSISLFAAREFFPIC